MQILGLRNRYSPRPDTGGWREGRERLGWDEKTLQKVRDQKPERPQQSDTGEKTLFDEKRVPTLCQLGEQRGMGVGPAQRGVGQVFQRSGRDVEPRGAG